MSGRKSRKSQKLGSSRRSHNRDIEEKEGDVGNLQTDNEEHKREQQIDSHTITESPPDDASLPHQPDQEKSTGISQPTSPSEHIQPQDGKNLLKQAEAASKKRKMGSTRKSRGFKSGVISEEEPEHILRVCEEINKEHIGTKKVSVEVRRSKEDNDQYVLSDYSSCQPTKPESFLLQSTPTGIISYEPELLEEATFCAELTSHSCHLSVVKLAENTLPSYETPMLSQLHQQVENLPDATGLKAREGSDNSPLCENWKNTESLSESPSEILNQHWTVDPEEEGIIVVSSNIYDVLKDNQVSQYAQIHSVNNQSSINIMYQDIQEREHTFSSQGSTAESKEEFPSKPFGNKHEQEYSNSPQKIVYSTGDGSEDNQEGWQNVNQTKAENYISDYWLENKNETLAQDLECINELQSLDYMKGNGEHKDEHLVGDRNECADMVEAKHPVQPTEPNENIILSPIQENLKDITSDRSFVLKCDSFSTEMQHDYFEEIRLLKNRDNVVDSDETFNLTMTDANVPESTDISTGSRTCSVYDSLEGVSEDRVHTAEALTTDHIIEPAENISLSLAEQLQTRSACNEEDIRHKDQEEKEKDGVAQLTSSLAKADGAVENNAGQTGQKKYRTGSPAYSGKCEEFTITHVSEEQFKAVKITELETNSTIDLTEDECKTSSCFPQEKWLDSCNTLAERREQELEDGIENDVAIKSTKMSQEDDETLTTVFICAENEGKVQDCSAKPECDVFDGKVMTNIVHQTKYIIYDEETKAKVLVEKEMHEKTALDNEKTNGCTALNDQIIPQILTGIQNDAATFNDSSQEMSVVVEEYDKENANQVHASIISGTLEDIPEKQDKVDISVNAENIHEITYDESDQLPWDHNRPKDHLENSESPSSLIHQGDKHFTGESMQPKEETNTSPTEDPTTEDVAVVCSEHVHELSSHTTEHSDSKTDDRSDHKNVEMKITELHPQSQSKKKKRFGSTRKPQGGHRPDNEGQERKRKDTEESEHDVEERCSKETTHHDVPTDLLTDSQSDMCGQSLSMIEPALEKETAESPDEPGECGGIDMNSVASTDVVVDSIDHELIKAEEPVKIIEVHRKSVLEDEQIDDSKSSDEQIMPQITTALQTDTSTDHDVSQEMSIVLQEYYKDNNENGSSNQDHAPLTSGTMEVIPETQDSVDVLANTDPTAQVSLDHSISEDHLEKTKEKESESNISLIHIQESNTTEENLITENSELSTSGKRRKIGSTRRSHREQLHGGNKKMINEMVENKDDRYDETSNTAEKLTEEESMEPKEDQNVCPTEGLKTEGVTAVCSEQHVLSELSSQTAELSLSTDTQPSPETEHSDSKSDEGNDHEDVEMKITELRPQSQSKKKKRFGSTRKPQGGHRPDNEAEERNWKDTEATEEIENDVEEKCSKETTHHDVPTDLLTDSQSDVSERTLTMIEPALEKETAESPDETGECGEMDMTSVTPTNIIVHAVDHEVIQAEGPMEMIEVHGKSVKEAEKFNDSESTDEQIMPLITTDMENDSSTHHDVSQEMSMVVEEYDKDNNESRGTNQVHASIANGTMNVIPETIDNEDEERKRKDTEATEETEHDMEERCSKETTHHEVTTDLLTDSQSDMCGQSLSMIEPALEKETAESPDEPGECGGIDTNSVASTDVVVDSIDHEVIKAEEPVKMIEVDRKSVLEDEQIDDTISDEKIMPQITTDMQTDTSTDHDVAQEMSIVLQEYYKDNSKNGSSNQDHAPLTSGTMEVIPETQDSVDVSANTDPTAQVLLDHSISEDHLEKTKEKESESTISLIHIQESNTTEENLITENSELSTSGKRRKIGSTRRSHREQLHGGNKKKINEMVENKDDRYDETSNTAEKLTEEESMEPKEDQNVCPTGLKTEGVTAVCSEQHVLSELSSQTAELSLSTDTQPSPETEHSDSKSDEGNDHEDVEMKITELHPQSQSKKKKRFGSTQKPQGGHRPDNEAEERNWKDTEATEEIEHDVQERCSKETTHHDVPTDLLTDSQSDVSERTLTMIEPALEKETAESPDETGECGEMDMTSVTPTNIIVHAVDHEVIQAEGPMEIIEVHGKSVKEAEKFNDSESTDEQIMPLITTDMENDSSTHHDVSQEMSMVVEEYDKDNNESRGTNQVHASIANGTINVIPETIDNEDEQRKWKDTEATEEIDHDVEESGSKETTHHDIPTDLLTDSQSDMCGQSLSMIEPALEKETAESPDEPGECGGIDMNSVPSTDIVHSIDHEAIKAEEPVKMIEVNRKSVLEDEQIDDTKSSDEKIMPQITTDMQTDTSTDHDVSQKMSIVLQKYYKDNSKNGSSNQDHAPLTSGTMEVIPETQNSVDVSANTDPTAQVSLDHSISEDHLEKTKEKESESTISLIHIQESNTTEENLITENSELSTSGKRRKIGSTRRSHREQLHGGNKKKINEMVENKDDKYNETSNTAEKLTEEESMEPKEDQNVCPTEGLKTEGVTAVCSEQHVLSQLSSQTAELSLSTDTQPSPVTECSDSKSNEGNDHEDVEMKITELHPQSQSKKKKRFGSTRKPQGGHRPDNEAEERNWKETEATKEIEHDVEESGSKETTHHDVPTDLLTDSQSDMNGQSLTMIEPALEKETAESPDKPGECGGIDMNSFESTDVVHSIDHEAIKAEGPVKMIEVHRKSVLEDEQIDDTKSSDEQIMSQITTAMQTDTSTDHDVAQEMSIVLQEYYKDNSKNGSSNQDHAPLTSGTMEVIPETQDSVDVSANTDPTAQVLLDHSISEDHLEKTKEKESESTISLIHIQESNTTEENLITENSELSTSGKRRKIGSTRRSHREQLHGGNKKKINEMVENKDDKYNETSNTAEKLTEEESMEPKEDQNVCPTEGLKTEGVTAVCSEQHVLSQLSSQTAELSLSTDTQPSPVTERSDSKSNEGNDHEDVEMKITELHRQSQSKKKKRFGSTRKPQGGHRPDNEAEERNWKETEATEEIEHDVEESGSKETTHHDVPTDLLTDSQSDMNGQSLTMIEPALEKETAESPDKPGECGGIDMNSVESTDVVHSIDHEAIKAEGPVKMIEVHRKSVLEDEQIDDTKSSDEQIMSQITTAMQTDTSTDHDVAQEMSIVLQEYYKDNSKNGSSNQDHAPLTSGTMEVIPETQDSVDVSANTDPTAQVLLDHSISEDHLEKTKEKESESTISVIHIQESNTTEENLITENSELSTSGKRRKIGSTRRSHREQLHGGNKKKINEMVENKDDKYDETSNTKLTEEESMEPKEDQNVCPTEGLKTEGVTAVCSEQHVLSQLSSQTAELSLSTDTQPSPETEHSDSKSDEGNDHEDVEMKITELHPQSQSKKKKRFGSTRKPQGGHRPDNEADKRKWKDTEATEEIENDVQERCSKETTHQDVPTDLLTDSQSDVSERTLTMIEPALEKETAESPDETGECGGIDMTSVTTTNIIVHAVDHEVIQAEGPMEMIEEHGKSVKEAEKFNDSESTDEQIMPLITTDIENDSSTHHDVSQEMSVVVEEYDKDNNESRGINQVHATVISGTVEFIPETKDSIYIPVNNRNFPEVTSNQLVQFPPDHSISEVHLEKITCIESESTTSLIHILESNIIQDNVITENSELSTSGKRRKIGSTRKGHREQLHGGDKKKMNELDENKGELSNEKRYVEENDLYLTDRSCISDSNTAEKLTEEESMEPKDEIITSTSKDLKNVEMKVTELHPQSQSKKKKRFGSTRRPQGGHRPDNEAEERKWKETEGTEKIERDLEERCSTESTDHKVPTHLLSESQIDVSRLSLSMIDPPLEKETAESPDETGECEMIDMPSVALTDNVVHSIDHEASKGEGLVENSEVPGKPVLEVKMIDDTDSSEVNTETHDGIGIPVNTSNQIKQSLDHNISEDHSEEPTEREPQSTNLVIHIQEIITTEGCVIAQNPELSTSGKRRKIGSTRRSHREQLHGGDKRKVNKEEENEGAKDDEERYGEENALNLADRSSKLGTKNVTEEESMAAKEEIGVSPTEDPTTEDFPAVCSEPHVLSELSSQTADLSLSTDTQPSPVTECSDSKTDDKNCHEDVEMKITELHPQSQSKKKKRFGSTRKPQGGHRPDNEAEERKWKDTEAKEEIENDLEESGSKETTHEVPTDLPTESQSHLSGLSLTMIDTPLEKEMQQQNAATDLHLQDSKTGQCIVIAEKSELSTSGKRRKMGSTRMNPREQHLRDDQKDTIKELKEEEIIKEPELEESTAVTEAVSLEAETLRNLNPINEETSYSSIATELSAESVNVVIPEVEKLGKKRRKMGSTRRSGKGGDGKKAMEETGDTDPRADEDITTQEIKSTTMEDMLFHDTAFGWGITAKTTGQDPEPQISDKSESSLLTEIEFELKMSCQRNPTASAISEISLNNPKSPYNLSENSQPAAEQCMSFSLELPPSQNSQNHTEINSLAIGSPVRRRKMGSTRKAPKNKLKEDMRDESLETEHQAENLEKIELETEKAKDMPMVKMTEDTEESVEITPKVQDNSASTELPPPGSKRKFGSRRITKGSRNLSGLPPDEFEPNQGKPEDVIVLSDELTVCDPYFVSGPQSTPVSQPVSEHSMEASLGNEPFDNSAVNEANVLTEAGLVSLDDLRKSALYNGSTGKREKIDFERWSEQIPDFGVAVYNVVMVGNSSVGKTSFMNRFQSGHFSPDYCSTIGVDTCVQTITLGGRTIKLHVWDTAGQERYHSITKQVFHKAQGLLLMYDITSSQSFCAVRNWVSQIKECAPDDVIMILLGNKNDCAERKVQLQEGEDLSREYKIHFLECSAATGKNVEESMKTLACLLVKQNVRREEDQTILQPKPPQQKSGCC